MDKNKEIVKKKKKVGKGRNIKIDKDKERVLKCLEEYFGTVTPALKAAKVPRSSYYNWLDNDPEFKKKVGDVYEVRVDFAEVALFRNVKKGVQPAIDRVLGSAHARARGWNVNKSEMEMTGVDGGPINTEIKVTFVDSKQ